MMPDLLPCPLCRSDGHLFGRPKWGVACMKAQPKGGCGIVLGGFDSAAQAIAAWNRRTPPEDTGASVGEAIVLDGREGRHG